MPARREGPRRLGDLDGEVVVVNRVVAGVSALCGPPGLSRSLFPPCFG
jgi:hypothetical protein